MNIIKKLGLLNVFLLLIVIFSSGVLVWELAQYYNSETIQPALRENKAKANTVEIAKTFQFQSRFDTSSWDTYTSETDTPLLTVKYPPGCFPVRSHAVGYCSFEKDQRMPTHQSVENEVFDMGYDSNYGGNSFDEATKGIIDQKTSSTDPWRLSDFEILEEGTVTVDGNEAYLLKIRGKPDPNAPRTLGQPQQNFSSGVGKDGYVYQNYLLFDVKYSNNEFPNRPYPWYLYNESKAPSEYFDTVLSTIHFTQKQK